MKVNSIIMKIKPRIIFRVLSTILCTTGLLYQSCQLLSQYMSGKSVVNIEVKREVLSNLPAITICYPEMVSMESAANYSDLYRHYYEKYKEVIKLVKWNRTLYDIHKENMTKIHFDFINNFAFHIQQYMKIVINNVSLPFKYKRTRFVVTKNGSLLYKKFEIPIIGVKLTGYMNDEDGNYSVLQRIESYNNTFEYNDEPVETVNFHQRAKCFTFFSFLNSDWSFTKINLDLIKITIDYNVNWFPPHIISKYYFAIHSPEIITELKIGREFMVIQPNADFYLSFAKINVNRHGEMESDCIDYSVNKYQKLRSDCIATCMLRKSWDENYLFAPFLIPTTFRKEHVNEVKQSPSNYTFMPPPDRLNEMTQECYTMCKEGCKLSYNIYDISPTKEASGYEAPTIKTSVITIQHNRLPDLFVSYIPETTFVSFIGNFGGLLGMWLGISFMAIFDDIYKLSNKLIMMVARSHENRNRLFVQPNIIININNNLEYELKFEIIIYIYYYSARSKS